MRGFFVVAIPMLTNPIPDQEVVINAENTTLNLFDHFDDPFTTGLVARFELFNPDNTFPNEGVTEVVLFDQDDQGAPLTVENFTNYVEDGDYVNSIIHRSVSDFIIQGGGFFLNDDSTISQVPTDDPVQNEFSSERSNLEGTIAMAKLGNDPDSATSQWFFNLGDNSENLDNQNGGFTVFGEVLSEEDAETVNSIAELPRLNLSEQLGSPFNTVPVNIEESENPPSPTIDDLVRYESITISQQEELEFTITNNSNPELVEARIEGGELILNYLPEETGEADITIEATNLGGETVEDVFSVAVSPEASNQDPIAVNDNFTTDENTAFTTDSVLSNDSDPEGNGLSVSAIDDSETLGLVTDNEDGTFHYDPNGQFDSLNEGETATDSFNYTVADDNDGTDIGTVTILINGITDQSEALQGDFNEDGITNLNDLGLFAAAFGSQEGDVNYNPAFDLSSNDGLINNNDVDQLATFFAQESVFA